MVRNIKGLIYKPFNLLYMAFLFFVLFTVASWFLSFFRASWSRPWASPRSISGPWSF